MPRCKVCKEKFQPKFFNQKSCFNPKCVVEYRKVKEEQDWKKQKKVLKDKVKTKSDYVKDLQKQVNLFIRNRDRYKPCISCNKPLKSKFDAGHYRSAGGFPELRFNENNIFGQCVRCNRDLHGNLIEYRINLIRRVGAEVVDWLEKKHEPKHYTISELKEMTKEYKLKNKQNGLRRESTK